MVVPALLGMLGVVSLFLAVTSYTGCPGPGPLKRHPRSELNELSDHINRSSGFKGIYPEPAPARSGVDFVRGRVWVEGTVPCGVLLAVDLELLADKPVMGPCPDI